MYRRRNHPIADAENTIFAQLRHLSVFHQISLIILLLSGSNFRQQSFQPLPPMQLNFCSHHFQPVRFESNLQLSCLFRKIVFAFFCHKISTFFAFRVFSKNIFYPTEFLYFLLQTQKSNFLSKITIKPQIDSLSQIILGAPSKIK